MMGSSSDRVRRIGALVCATIAVAMASEAFAQIAIRPTATSSQNRADILRNQATPFGTPTPTSEENGYAAASPNDKDLGEQQILQRQEEYLPFTFSASMPIYWTSNAALVNEGEEDDVLFAPGVVLTYQPRITGTLFAEVGVAQQWFIYGDLSELNFSSFDGIVGLVYYLPQFHNLTLRGRYDYNRLTDTDFDEFFHNHSLILSASVPFRINRSQQVAVGFDIDISLDAHPEAPRRNEYSFWVGYSVNLTRMFSIDATARLAVRDYHAGNRTDVSEILSLAGNYHVNQWFTISVLTSFSWNQSDHDVFEYSVADLGGAITGTIQF
jgi:hypothetical protein